MSEQVLFIFWDGAFRLLSTGGTGPASVNQKEAMLALFDNIAANESNIDYLNQIYDNAQVELAPDNMQEITVQDFYYIQYIYIKHKAFEISDTVLTYEPTGKDPIGMAYAPRDPQGPQPNFEKALLELMKKMKADGEAYRKEDRKLFDS